MREPDSYGALPQTSQKRREEEGQRGNPGRRSVEGVRGMHEVMVDSLAEMIWQLCQSNDTKTRNPEQDGKI